MRLKRDKAPKPSGRSRQSAGKTCQSGEKAKMPVPGMRQLPDGTALVAIGSKNGSDLEAAIAQMSQGFAIFGPDQRLVVCNDAFRRFYDLADEFFSPGTLFWDILDEAGKSGLLPADGGIGYDALEAIIVARGSWSGVNEMTNGKIVSTVHEPLANGGWISLLEDVSDRAQREQTELERLREVEAQTIRFNAAIDSLNHGLAMFDANSKLVLCNQTYARLFQLPKALTVPGTPFADIYRYRDERGLVGVKDELFSKLRSIEDLVSTRGSFNGDVELKNGRVMLIRHQPIADGGWLTMHEDITEQHRNAEALRFMARHDNLTGLINRTAFLELLADAERNIATGDRMALFSIDLVRFKDINDTFGHAIGDSTLVAFAERLRAVFEGHGEPARLGGDEFAVLVGPLKTRDEAVDLGNALLDSLRQPFRLAGMDVPSAASIGVAVAPTHGSTASELMHSVNLAMSQAQSETRSSLCVFEPDMDHVFRRRQMIELGLADAIADETLSIVYQPLIALETGRVACCEALMRWHSPALGAVSPTEFIPVAEETGLIRSLGDWALKTACLEAASWPSHVRLAVNVSPVQFRGDDLVDQVSDALTESGLDPSRLELEITESLFLADDEHNLAVLHRLRALGVRFALDDFGTGYSSLAYMLRFPFDKVKIDRSIVSTIAERQETALMVTAITDLCRGFHMQTVAEGVETEEQLKEIRAHGCDEVQGYVFSPALPREAIKELLLRKRGVPSVTAPRLRRRAS